MFSNTINAFLLNMGFEPNQFYKRVSKLYAPHEAVFGLLIEDFFHQAIIETEDFNHFINLNNIKDSSNIFDPLYELFNNIRQFKSGGKLGLFKEREAAWGLPSNILNQSDIIDIVNLLDLTDEIEIFRGMSQEEYDNGDFGQSWSTDYETARKFAEEFYSDKAEGIVVKTTLDKGHALHYDKNKEFEVITMKGSINQSSVFIVN